MHYAHDVMSKDMSTRTVKETGQLGQSVSKARKGLAIDEQMNYHR